MKGFTFSINFDAELAISSYGNNPCGVIPPYFPKKGILAANPGLSTIR